MVSTSISQVSASACLQIDFAKIIYIVTAKGQVAPK
jgi:hypothetical protein